MSLLRNIRNQIKGFSWLIKGTKKQYSPFRNTDTIRGDKLEKKGQKRLLLNLYISKELFRFPPECFRRGTPLILIQEVTTDILKFSQLYPKPSLGCSRTFVNSRNHSNYKRASTQRKQAILLSQLLNRRQAELGDPRKRLQAGPLCLIYLVCP